MNPNPGEFEFDISRLNLAVGSQVTVTANYSQDPVGAHDTPTLTTLFSGVVELGQPAPTTESPLVVARDGNNLTLSWGGGGFILQSATTVVGPWTNEATSGTTFTTQATGPGKFFRLVRGTAPPPPPPPSGSPSLAVTRGQGTLTVTWSGARFKLHPNPRLRFRNSAENAVKSGHANFHNLYTSYGLPLSGKPRGRWLKPASRILRRGFGSSPLRHLAAHGVTNRLLTTHSKAR